MTSCSDLDEMFASVPVLKRKEIIVLWTVKTLYGKSNFCLIDDHMINPGYITEILPLCDYYK